MPTQPSQRIRRDGAQRRISNHYQNKLLTLFSILFAVSCFRALYPRDLLVQHIPTVLVVVALSMTRRRWPLSNTAVTLILAFMVLHLLGARYVYSYVPYDDWFRQTLGVSVNDMFASRRNHYDRFVHFCYGLLLIHPVREIHTCYLRVPGTWSIYLAVEFILATSMLYELGEWLAAVALAADWADRYLGQQGDMWDAHKDMALATVGAILAAATAVWMDCLSRKGCGAIKSPPV